MDVSLSVRTRQLSVVLIEINGGSDAFFKMELRNGRVNVHYISQGETGRVLSGKTEPRHSILLLKENDSAPWNLPIDGAVVTGCPCYFVDVFYLFFC